MHFHRNMRENYLKICDVEEFIIRDLATEGYFIKISNMFKPRTDNAELNSIFADGRTRDDYISNGKFIARL